MALQVPPFNAGQLEAICRELGEAITGSQLSRLLPDAVKPAAHNAWVILTQVLADRAWAWIILGIVALVGVWFVGETRRAADARRATQPVLKNRLTTYAIAAGALLVLALVAPAIARGWLSALVLIGLIIAGIEVVRSFVLRGGTSPVGR